MTPAATPEALEQAPYVLLKRGLFERPDHHGYTGVLRHAGRFSYKEASAYSGHGDGVTMMPASEAPDYSPACWHETQVEDLLDLLRIEREAKDAALADHQRVTAERDEARNPFGASTPTVQRIALLMGQTWLEAVCDGGHIVGTVEEFAMVSPEDYAACCTVTKAVLAAVDPAKANERADTATAEAASLRAEVEAVLDEFEPRISRDRLLPSESIADRVRHIAYEAVDGRAGEAGLLKTVELYEAANLALRAKVEAKDRARWRPIATAPTDRPVVVRMRTDRLQGGWFVATVTLPDPDDDSRFGSCSTIWHYNGDTLMTQFRGTWTDWLDDGGSDRTALARAATAGEGRSDG